MPQHSAANHSSAGDDIAVFVVGNSRSGTTLMARILEGQGSVYFLREFHFFEELWAPEELGRKLSDAEKLKLVSRCFFIQNEGYIKRGDAGRYTAEAKKFISEHPSADMEAHDIFYAFIEFLARSNGRRIPCDQTPRNVFYLREILDLYPGARVINMVRDPRDILYSQKYKWRRRYLGGRSYTPLRESIRVWLNYHPFTMSRLWKAAVTAAEKGAGDSRVRTVSYEDLTRNQEGTVRGICDFLGIAFVPEMLRVPQEGSSDKTDFQENRGIVATNVQKWKKGGLNHTEIYICQKMLGKIMDRKGYEYYEVRPNPFFLAWYLGTFPVKLLLSFVFNLHRMKNIAETIKRRLS